MRLIAGLAAIAALSLSPAPALARDTAEAGVSITLVSPAEASAGAAFRLLFSQTPGVLTIAIPGAGALELTATGIDASSGTFTFAASSTRAAALRALMSRIAAAVARGEPVTGLTVAGFLAGQGVQLVILSGNQAPDGAGTLRATITFD